MPLRSRIAPAQLVRCASAVCRQVAYTDAEWRARLSAEQYAVLRREATERRWTRCVCGAEQAPMCKRRWTKLVAAC